MRTTLRKISTGAMVGVAVGAMTLGALAGTASAKPDGHCGQTFNPETDGASAHWTLNCSGGQITVKGWYRDDEADGDCVGVKAHFADGSTKRSETCAGWRTKKNFSWTAPGALADVYLYEYDG